MIMIPGCLEIPGMEAMIPIPGPNPSCGLTNLRGKGLAALFHLKKVRHESLFEIY